MESEIKHLSQNGNLSEDYLWKVENAYRSIKNDAEWCEHRSILTLHDRMYSNADKKSGTQRLIAHGITRSALGIVVLAWYLLASLIALPILMGLFKFLITLGLMKESYPDDEMASFGFLYGIVLMLAIFVGSYSIGFYLVRLPFWFIFGGHRLNTYKKNREVLIKRLLDEGIRDFGGAMFARELAATVPLLDVRSGGVSKFLRELKSKLDSGHISQQSGSSDEAIFYNKGFKEKVGGIFAVSTMWVILILFAMMSISAILFFLWRRFLN